MIRAISTKPVATYMSLPTEDVAPAVTWPRRSPAALTQSCSVPRWPPPPRPQEGNHWGMATFHPTLPGGAGAGGSAGSLAEILVGPAYENDGRNLFGALRTSMATTGYADVKGVPEGGMLAPSLQTEGKALQRAQRVGNGLTGLSGYPTPASRRRRGRPSRHGAGGRSRSAIRPTDRQEGVRGPRPLRDRAAPSPPRDLERRRPSAIILSGGPSRSTPRTPIASTRPYSRPAYRCSASATATS